MNLFRDDAPIALIGMMGAGKTSVGRRLAHRLGRAFVDADRELEARCGVSVATIFELEGEDGFRQREAALIDELTARPGLVLATGGGAVLRAESTEQQRLIGSPNQVEAVMSGFEKRDPSFTDPS